MTKNHRNLSQEEIAHRGIAAAMEIVHTTARNAGWYRNPMTGDPIARNVGESIALMHSELSEALEAYRTGQMDKNFPKRSGFEVELADCVIRIFDTAESLGLDLAGAIIEKNAFNRTRVDHTPEERVKGKRF